MESGTNDSGLEALVHPCPINNLPLEIFAAMIRLIFDSGDSKYSDNNLQSLRLVSKKWLQELDATSYVWTTIHSAAPPSWIVSSLERSKDLPLTIRCDLPQSLEASPSYANLTSLLVPQRHRWKKLSVALTGRYQWPVPNPLPLLQTYDMQNLESLTLSGLGTETVPWNDFGGHPPRLRSVYLKNYSIPWNSAILHSGTLQYLYLIDLMGEMPTTTELCNILIHSPRLRLVEIQSQISIHDTDPPSSDPIDLPHLTRLCLDVERHFLYHLLPRLQIPACTRLKVGMENVYLSQFDKPGLVQHLVSRLLDLAGNLTVKATRCGKYHIKGQSGWMDLHSIENPDVLTTLLNAYATQASLSTGPPSITTLIREPSGSRANPIAAYCLSKVVSKFVDRIVISRGVGHDRGILRCLSMHASSPTKWPCSNLAKVELAYCPEMAEDILAFVKARCNGAPEQAVRLHMTSTEHRPDEQMHELIRTHELVDFEWKGGDSVLGIGLEL